MRHYLIAAALFFLASTAQQTSAQPKALKLPGIPGNMHWENLPLDFTLLGSNLMIKAGPKTDMFRDPNVTYNTDNAPKLLFKADPDFVLTATIQHPFTNKWDGAALVIKQDSLHWIKFCFEKDYLGSRRIVTVVTNGVSDDSNSIEIPSGQAVFKMAKADNVITLYCSADGKNWLLVRHLQFDFKPGFDVGFLSQSPTGEFCRATFTAIRYQHKKIKDPYAGE
jgi:hypothetical protein